MNMDDSIFEYERADVDAGSARFPARPVAERHVAGPGLHTLQHASGASFAQHAWDESGHL